MTRIITVVWVSSGVHAEGVTPRKRQGNNTNHYALFVAMQIQIKSKFKKV